MEYENVRIANGALLRLLLLTLLGAIVPASLWAQDSDLRPIAYVPYLNGCRDIDNYVDSANAAIKDVTAARSDYDEAELARARAMMQLTLLSDAVARCEGRQISASADSADVGAEAVQSAVDGLSAELEVNYAATYYAVAFLEHVKSFNGTLSAKTKASLKKTVDQAKKLADTVETASRDADQQSRASAIRQQLDSWTGRFELF